MRGKKTQKNEIFSYHTLDTRKIDELITEKIVDVIITSPPYWNLKDYDVDNQIGSGQSYKEYLIDLKKIFSYCSKITKDTGSLWIIIDTFKKDGTIKLLPFDLVREIQKEWNLQDIIIWAKDKTLPWSHKGSMRNIFEYILFFTKKNESSYKYNIDRIKKPSELKRWWVKYPERYNPNGKTPPRLWELPIPDKEIWKIPIPTQGTWGNGWVRHACPFPPELIERILLLTTDEGDVVLDPFAGSGSVIAQAQVMKRNAIGLDISKDYKTMYEDKVLPEIKRLWKSRMKDLKKRKKDQIILKEKIEKLRKIKYPKELIKRSIKSGLSKEIVEGINSIFVLNDKDKKIGSKYFIVFNDLAPTNEMVPELWKTKSKRPLTIYGFKPEVKLIDKKMFIKERGKLKIPNNLNLYSKGKTNYFKKPISFDDWLIDSSSEDWKNNFKDNVPPIISDIEIREKERELN